MNYQILFILIASFLAFYAVFMSAPDEEDNPPNEDKSINNANDKEEILEIVK